MKTMVEHIYTDDVADSHALMEHGEEMLAIAEKYQVDSFKLFMEHYLATRINTESVFDLVALAEIHSAELLKEAGQR